MAEQVGEVLPGSRENLMKAMPSLLSPDGRTDRRTKPTDEAILATFASPSLTTYCRARALPPLPTRLAHSYLCFSGCWSQARQPLISGPPLPTDWNESLQEACQKPASAQ